LPNAVVDVDSVDLFKSRLDNFWMSQDVSLNIIILSTLPVPEIDLSMTLKVFTALHVMQTRYCDENADAVL